MQRKIIDINYKEVRTEVEKFVTDWFEESKKKSKIAHSPEYLAWIDDIVTKNKDNCISDDSDVWFETWYQELPETDQYNITCLEKFLDFVYDEAEKQGIDSCHNYNINPEDEAYNPFEVVRYYYTHVDNLDNYSYCIRLMIGQGSAVDVWRVSKKDIPSGIKVVKL